MQPPNLSKWRNPYLDPEEVWGKFDPEFWSEDDRGLYDLCLVTISSRLPFAEQVVINRVTLQIKSIIKRVNANEMTPEEVFEIINPPLEKIYSKEELKVIENNSKLYGGKMTKLFLNKDDRDNS